VRLGSHVPRKGRTGKEKWALVGRSEFISIIEKGLNKGVCKKVMQSH